MEITENVLEKSCDNSERIFKENKSVNSGAVHLKRSKAFQKSECGSQLATVIFLQAFTRRILTTLRRCQSDSQRPRSMFQRAKRQNEQSGEFLSFYELRINILSILQIMTF